MKEQCPSCQSTFSLPWRRYYDAPVGRYLCPVCHGPCPVRRRGWSGRLAALGFLLGAVPSLTFLGCLSLAGLQMAVLYGCVLHRSVAYLGWKWTSSYAVGKSLLGSGIAATAIVSTWTSVFAPFAIASARGIDSVAAFVVMLVASFLFVSLWAIIWSITELSWIIHRRVHVAWWPVRLVAALLVLHGVLHWFNVPALVWKVVT